MNSLDWWSIAQREFINPAEVDFLVMAESARTIAGPELLY